MTINLYVYFEKSFTCIITILSVNLFSELGGEKIKNKKDVEDAQKEMESSYRKKIGYKKTEEKVNNELFQKYLCLNGQMDNK